MRSHFQFYGKEALNVLFYYSSSDKGHVTLNNSFCINPNIGLGGTKPNVASTKQNQK